MTGWKRLEACRQLCVSPLPVFIFNEINDLKAFHLAFFENLVTREFHLIEKAEVISKLLKFGESDQNIIQNFLPLLGIPPTFSYFDMFRKIAKMSKKEKRIVWEKNLSLGVIEQLVRFSPYERKKLLPHIVCLSQNKRKELLELAKELSLKNEVPVEVILESKKIKNVIQNTKLSQIQKAEKIRVFLQEERFPRLASRQKIFESAKRQLALPKDVEISPTAFFEDEEFLVKFSFKDKGSLLKKLSLLKNMAEDKNLIKVLKTVDDE